MTGKARGHTPGSLRAPAIIRHHPGLDIDGAVPLAPRISVVPAAPFSIRIGAQGPQAIALHGCGVVHGRFVTDVAELQEVLDGTLDGSPDTLGSGIRGVLTAYIWSPGDQSLDLLPDPWGGLVHRYRDSEVEVLSSDLGAVVQTLDRLGRRPHKSLDFATEVAAMGSGGLTPSSYEGVEVLDVMQWARIDSTGVHIHNYRVASDLAVPFDSYEEGLAAVRTEIEQNVAAVLASSHKTVLAHLTGGIDTRMVLGATLAQGLTGELAYLSLGPRSMPDRAIAENLAVEFGLTMTEFQGSAVTSAPSTLAEQSRWPMEFSRGLLTAGPHAHRSGSDTVVLSGAYGGYLKGNYSKVLEAEDAELSRESSRRLTQRLWGSKAFSSDPALGLYTPEVIDRRLDRFHNLRVAATGRGLGAGEALDWLFISVRNRYFLTEATRTWNAFVHRFDPLYSLAGVRLARTIGTRERSTNCILLDLLRGWEPRLAALPFDYPRVTPAYESLRSPVELADWSRPGVRPRCDGRPGPAPPPGGRSDVSADTPEVIARATALQAPLWQIRDLDRVRADLRQIVSDGDSAQLGEVFNLKQLHGMLRWELKHRGLVRQVHHLHSALLWYAAE